MTEPDVTTGAAWRVIDHLRRCREIVVGVDDGNWARLRHTTHVQDGYFLAMCLSHALHATGWPDRRREGSGKLAFMLGVFFATCTERGCSLPYNAPGHHPVCLQARHQGEAFR